MIIDFTTLLRARTVIHSYYCLQRCRIDTSQSAIQSLTAAAAADDDDDVGLPCQQR